MLVLNPSQRATIEELMYDDFLAMGDIPKHLPLSSLACPPSQSFIEQVKMECINSKKIDNEPHIYSSRTSKDSSKSHLTFAK